MNDSWDGRQIKMYYGDPAWPKSDFRLLLNGMIADIYAKDQATLALKLRDKTWALNVPIQTNLIGGSTANAGQPVPLCYGPCFNVTPVLTNAATHEYQVHDGPINDILAVYDGGVPVAFTKDLTHGKFTLSSAPVYEVTSDPQGAKVGGV